MLEKYKNKMDIGVYLAIKEKMDKMEADLKNWEEAFEIQQKNTEYWRTQMTDLMNASFMEKWKFLFNKKESEV